MDLTEKIKLILFNKNLSPSLFADEVGIQRSSMSHILAGRNKPSLEIVQRIIRRYPDLGVNWILDGEPLDLPVAEPDQNVSRQPSQNDLAFQTSKEPEPQHQPVPEITREPVRSRTVEKVMIFYSDGTFQEFKS